MNELQNSVRYAIDASDKIVSVGGNWDRFAAENDSPPEVFARNILHRSFWDFISGDLTEHVYRQILAKVRAGTKLHFNFRCDSPTLRRFLTLDMIPNAAGGIEFLTETTRTEKREYQPLFCTNADKIIEMVITCSWCNKIKTGEKVWQECEDAVLSLGLFEDEAMPMLSHGMCEDCYRTVMSSSAMTAPEVT
ncbi:MAG: hypothetical protein ABJA02_09455 [Acidobacteriota bacterium]